MRRHPGLGARQFALGKTVGRDALRLFVDGAQHLLDVAARRQVRLEDQGRGVAHRERLAHEADVAADAGDRTVAKHQTLDQPGGVAVGEDLGQYHVRQVAIEIVDRIGNPPGRGHGRKRREPVFEGLPALGGQVGLGEVGSRRGRPARHVAEVPLDQQGGGGDVEVTGHREHRAARGVVPLEEVGRVGDGRGVQIAERAVAVVRVGERVEHHRRQAQPREPAVRAVEHVDPDFLLDHVDLIDQVLLGQPRLAHPVGLEEQRAFQSVRRKRLEVVRVVEVSRSVEGPARPLHIAEVRELLQALRTLEHQVLEKVGKAGAPFRLGADADVVDDGDAHHRCAAVGSQHHPEAVGQGEALDRILRSWNPHGCAATRHVSDINPSTVKPLDLGWLSQIREGDIWGPALRVCRPTSGGPTAGRRR